MDTAPPPNQVVGLSAKIVLCALPSILRLQAEDQRGTPAQGAACEIGLGEVRLAQVCLGEVGRRRDGPRQPRAAQVGAAQRGPRQDRPREVDELRGGAVQAGLGQQRPGEARRRQRGPREDGAREVRAAQVDRVEGEALQVRLPREGGLMSWDSCLASCLAIHVVLDSCLAGRQ